MKKPSEPVVPGAAAAPKIDPQAVQIFAAVAFHAMLRNFGERIDVETIAESAVAAGIAIATRLAALPR